MGKGHLFYRNHDQFQIQAQEHLRYHELVVMLDKSGSHFLLKPHHEKSLIHNQHLQESLLNQYGLAWLAYQLLEYG